MYIYICVYIYTHDILYVYKDIQSNITVCIIHAKTMRLLVVPSGKQLPTSACILHHAQYFGPARNLETVQIFAGTTILS